MIFISRCLKCRTWHKNKNMIMFNYINGVMFAYERGLGYFPELHGPVCGACKDDLIKVYGMLRMQEQACNKFKEKYLDIVSPNAVLVYEGPNVKVYEEVING